MLRVVGYNSMDSFIDDTIPQEIRVDQIVDTEGTERGIRPLSELELRRRVEEIAAMNKPMKSYIGMGYHNAIVPPVIQRNVSQHDKPKADSRYSKTPPGTLHTHPTLPSNPRDVLESLINFQTVAISLTALPIANASLLDEATASAEGMAMCLASVPKNKKSKRVFLVSPTVAPQTLAVLGNTSIRFRHRAADRQEQRIL